jgi:C_GCAxxG_C_C family probable redox protein
MGKIFDNTMLEGDSIELFESGLNCTQSVLSVYSDYLNIENKMALNIASGFGAGMGRLQETCGAVTGAYMVFGLFAGRKSSDNQEKLENTYLMVQAFRDRFLEKHNSTDCRELLNCDLRTEEGKEYFVDKNLKTDICKKCISDSIGLINEILNKC